MNRILVSVIIGLMVAAFFLLYIGGALDPNGIFKGKKMCENCNDKYGVNSTETYYNISSDKFPIYSYAFWFNNSSCNETNTETHYESKKADGYWQIVTVMTCLNETVRVIPQ